MGKLALTGGEPVRTSPFPSWPVYDEREKKYLLEVLESGRWGRNSGNKNSEFERKFAEFQEAKHAITVCNGTVALRVALYATGIGPGDEVIVPSYTFIATATTVIEANAIPVFADIEENSFNISPESVEELVNERTRAIIPVHFGGAPANMDRILEIAKKHSLVVIEDAAQAQGSEWKGNRVGALGDAGTFSFQLSKNMTAGEGGAVVTNDDAVAERVLSFYNCGRKPGYPWYIHFEISGNYRLSEFQAAVLLAQLEREEEQIRRRNENAAYLNQLLSSIEGVEPIRYPDYVRSSYYLYIFKYSKEAFGEIDKNTLVEALRAEGIPAMEGYPFPLYRQPLFQKGEFWKRGCPFSCRFYGKKPDYRDVKHFVAERACQVGLWLPNYVLLAQRKDMEDIAEALEKIRKNIDELRRKA